jgi:hypothetical protein
MKKKMYIDISHASMAEDGILMEFAVSLRGELNAWVEEFLDNPLESKLFNAFRDAVESCWQTKDYVADED